jgi:hypothetical protein
VYTVEVAAGPITLIPLRARLVQHIPCRKPPNHNVEHTLTKLTLNSDVVYLPFRQMKNDASDYASWLPPYTSARQMNRAHNKIAKLVKSGLMPRPTTRQCILCNLRADVYHHHVGYEPPDDTNVVPMCWACHTKVHNSQTYLLPSK